MKKTPDSVTVFKKRFSRSLCLSAIVLSGCFGAFAGESENDTVLKLSPDRIRIQNMIESTHIIGEGSENQKKDSLYRMLNNYYYDQFRHSQDPRAPYFMFLSKNGNLALGMGGVIRMRGYFDWNGSIPISGFSPYYIPIPKDPTSEKSLAANPSGTAFFMTLFGQNSIFGNYVGHIEAGFSGYNNRDFKLKKAYIQAGDWTAGYATTTFEDTKAEPTTVDGAGANGINTRTNVLVRYMHTFKGNHWTVAGSLEIPSSSIDADGVTTKACADYVPDFAAFGQFQWNEGMSHIRLSGLLRVLSYRDLLKEQNKNIVGWATQLSAVGKVLPQFNLYGIASVGQGHASYTTDLAGGSFDLVAKEGCPGELYAPTAVGYVFGASYYFTPSLYSNIALSEQRYYPRSNPDNAQYKYGLYGAFNLFWDITPRFEVGLEYLAGKRVDFSGEKGNANRITAMMMLSF